MATPGGIQGNLRLNTAQRLRVSGRDRLSPIETTAMAHNGFVNAGPLSGGSLHPGPVSARTTLVGLIPNDSTPAMGHQGSSSLVCTLQRGGIS